MFPQVVIWGFWEVGFLGRWHSGKTGFQEKGISGKIISRNGISEKWDSGKIIFWEMGFWVRGFLKIGFPENWFQEYGILGKWDNSILR